MGATARRLLQFCKENFPPPQHGDESWWDEKFAAAGDDVSSLAVEVFGLMIENEVWYDDQYFPLGTKWLNELDADTFAHIDDITEVLRSPFFLRLL